jgi:hypothetical protein
MVVAVGAKAGLAEQSQIKKAKAFNDAILNGSHLHRRTGGEVSASKRLAEQSQRQKRSESNAAAGRPPSAPGADLGPGVAQADGAVEHRLAGL